MSISPSHGRMSVVTGLRIYTANNNPNADPVKYRIAGRYTSGANVNFRMDGLCWWVNGNNRLKSATCDSVSLSQRFYMNDINEIRVKSHPDKCLDPSYGLNHHYEGNLMSSCLSDIYGADNYNAQYQKFTLHPCTG